MEHFPIFVDVRRRRPLVVGGGPEAARKVELLLRAGARPLVVASHPGAEIGRWIALGRCDHRAGRFELDDLADASLVIVADDDQAAATVSAAAQARGLPVNVVDRPELCSFVMPAIVDRSPVVVAISTGGASPTLARMIQAQLQEVLPMTIGRVAQTLGAMRPFVRRLFPSGEQRREVWRRLLTTHIARLARVDREGASYDRLIEAFTSRTRRTRTDQDLAA